MVDFRVEEIFGLKDKVIFITGAAGQLGCELANAYLANGARVVAVDLNLSALETVAQRENWEDSNIRLVACDIRNLSEVQQAFKVGIDFFGTLDILVCNAGVGVFEPFFERKEESIDWVMDVNLKGTFFCIREFIKLCELKKQGGNIVNIASIYGVISSDPRIYTDCERKNSEIYGATKAGIIHMTKYFAIHGAPFNVRTNSVSLGGIRNPFNPQGEDFQKNYGFRCPMGRMAETHEIVGSVLFLSSSASSYVNGHNLVVDGGMSAW